MDLEAILEGIRKAGKQQVELIEQDADRQSSEILSKAQADANVQKNRILADGKTRLNREQALIEQQFLIQALQVHADARQSLIEEVLQKVQDRFPEMRNQKDYEVILEDLADEAVHSITPSLFKGQKVVLRFDPRDKKRAEHLIKKYNLPISVRYDLSCSGGCCAESEDGKILAMNTLESRFEHAFPYIKQNLSIFFESKMNPR